MDKSDHVRNKVCVKDTHLNSYDIGIYIEDIRIFVMNMTFISSSEVKNIYIRNKKVRDILVCYFIAINRFKLIM